MTLDPVLALYGVVTVVVLVTLWRWNNSDRYKDFYLLDLIAEEGRLSSRKFMEFGAWLVMTIAFVMLVNSDKLTEWYVLAYGGLWVGARTAGQFIHARKET